MTIPDEWVNVAAEAIRARWDLPLAASWENVSSDARIALAAVLPLVERRLRDNIADEIRATAREDMAIRNAEITRQHGIIQRLDADLTDARAERDAAVVEAGRVREALQAVRGFLAWLTAMGEPTEGAWWTP